MEEASIENTSIDKQPLLVRPFYSWMFAEVEVWVECSSKEFESKFARAFAVLCSVAGPVVGAGRSVLMH